MRRKIAIVTGTRAEYGQLYWVLKAIQDSSAMELQLVVTGMHLSPEFGLTYKKIEEDGFTIDKKVEILLSSDTEIGLSKSMGLALISMSEALSQLKPDLVLVLGDRFEIMATVTAAMISRIPIAHCHGGEATEGLIDEAIRHCITKMSHIHFVATEAYKRRVIQLGEAPKSVFNSGALAIENINKLQLLTKEEFETQIDFSVGNKSCLVTFHPVTLDEGTAESQFQNLLGSLDEYPELKVLFTFPNADTDGRIIIQLIGEYVKKKPSRAKAFTSLGQLRYLSALRHITFVLGNSSSGLTEAPSFGIPTINIGDRQRGRIMADSVIQCEPTSKEISLAIRKALSPEFQSISGRTKNPYGTGNASETIIPVLETMDFSQLLKKKFYDL